MNTIGILSLLTFLPLVGAAAMFVVRPNMSKWVALFTSLVVLVLSGVMMLRFQTGNADFQFVEQAVWFPFLNLQYYVGVDGISVYFVVLAALLTPMCILASFGSITHRLREYLALFLVLETFMIGTFVALDTVLFYVFFEGVLIPMFLIIGIWGGQRRIYAAFKFFLYTLLGSVLMLVAVLALYAKLGTTSMPILMQSASALPFNWQVLLFLAMFASFAVKMPMWPVHTWLPDAHVEAPTGGSIILAGVLLKMGGYGFLRFSLPMFPEASMYFAPMIFTLSIIAIVYTSLVALVQTDMKKMIAYSSVAHMGYVTLGIFTLTEQGVEGAVFQMVSHGIVAGALFMIVGVVYDRLHTRDMNRYGGIVKNMPIYATLFMVFMLASVGLPGTSGFVGEFLVLMGAYKLNPWLAVFAGAGLVLGATYMLWLYRSVVFGAGKNADALAMLDVNGVERLNLGILAVLVIALGVAPWLIMRNIGPSVENLLIHVLPKPPVQDLYELPEGHVLSPMQPSMPEITQ